MSIKGREGEGSIVICTLWQKVNLACPANLSWPTVDTFEPEKYKFQIAHQLQLYHRAIHTLQTTYDLTLVEKGPHVTANTPWLSVTAVPLWEQVTAL